MFFPMPDNGKEEVAAVVDTSHMHLDGYMIPSESELTVHWSFESTSLGEFWLFGTRSDRSITFCPVFGGSMRYPTLCCTLWGTP